MSGHHSRQRQHRRQNSTPSAFDAVKIAPLPNLQQRRPVSHRRGLSLDTRAHHQPLAPAPPTGLRQEYVPVEATTPQNLLRQPGHQQRSARPALSQAAFAELEAADNFLVSPQVTPQSRRFTNAMAAGQGQLPDLSGLPFDTYAGAPALFERSVNRLGDHNMEPSQEFDFFAPDSALSTPSFLTFPDSSPGGLGEGWGSESETASTSRKSSRRVSNGIMNKAAKLDAMGSGFEGADRPCTPNSQIASDYFPQTPVEASVKQEATSHHPPNRFSEGYDESMEETLKPIRIRNPNRASGIFQDLRQQAEAMAHTPPRAGNIPMAINNQALRTPEFMNMRNISAEFRKIEREFGSFPESPMDAPSMFSFMKSDSSMDDKTPFPALSLEGNDIPHLGPPSPVSGTPSRRTSPHHRRTESVASVTSAASIADINIEETKTETGVTLEEISAFIQGPDPTDGKWRCLYEGCNKPFGRKENIKSHVQTHLNDRQYQCPTCKKCFVRQHDLKRHAKIHTGIKPYPCECGNSFARHDALTRHRQRGMCIGAFDGVVRKVVKRGRPKKIRPDMDERRDKAERTRRKNKLGSTSSANSASSQSGYSDVSGANSPNSQHDFDGLLDDDHFSDILSSSIASLPSVTGADVITTTTTLAALTAASSLPPATTTMADVFPTPTTTAGLSPSAMSSFSSTSTSFSHHHQQHPQIHHAHHYQPPSRPQSTASHYANTTHFNPPPNHHHHHTPPSPTKSLPPSSSQPHPTHIQYTHAHPTPPDDNLSSPRSPPPFLPASSSSSSDSSSAASRFFDLDSGNGDSSGIAGGLGHSVGTAGSGCGVGGGSGGAAEEMLLLPGAGVGGQEDEDGFDPVSMFTSGEDVFFGTA
ncbi:metallothionein expression activator [Dichotomopilus funicola]|uniref:Metallothionein expression activator n=1 Tax=Dichotomopilus funicola TaxID=1934379 RepID=A0AAN6V3M6_9PEZI|nr:metallothionein expression activator [Dichotomopilus funicola]